jgi:hypothetical protein
MNDHIINFVFVVLNTSYSIVWMQKEKENSVSDGSNALQF